MRRLLFFTLLVISIRSFSQDSSSVKGIITDKEDIPVEGATITIKGTNRFVITNSKGEFAFKNVDTDLITIVVSHVGYETLEVVGYPEKNVNLQLTRSNTIGNEVVVSASRRPEKITNAPASIQVIGIKDFDQFAGSNVGELFSKIQGIEYTRSGVTDITVNARGFNSAFNNKVVQLVDGRNSMAALSAGLPVMNRGVSIKEDIEQIEIVLGPQSALYGPNAHNAVFNFITKDPRKYPGTTLSVSAGSRYQFSSRLRHATKINNKWAYKMTGEYAVGKDFTFYDSVYAGNQPPGAQPFFGPAVTIPERNVDFDFRHIRGEGSVFYRLANKADIIISGGGSTNNLLQVTTAGRNQMQGVTYGFLQARFVHPRLFANVYNTWGSLGTSYSLQNYTRDYWNITHSTALTGPNRRLPPDSAEAYALRTRFKEESQRLNAELQYNYQFKKAGLYLVAGLNYQQEKPNGFGITLIDSFNRINITQYGAVLQLDKSLPWGLRFITTTRIDHHDNFGNFVSPRLALLKSIGDGNVRITWGKAYAMPSIQNQYAGINRFLFGNGKGITYIATDAKYSDTKSVIYIEPLKPEQVNTWEVGYKGNVGKLFIDINYYNGLSKNFISPARAVRGRILTVNGNKVDHNPATAGAVINDTLRNASFSTFFNYGDARAYGVDAGLHYTFNRFLNLAVKYSRFGSNISEDNMKNDANKDGYVSLEERAINTPVNRGVIILGLQNLLKEKLFVNLSARYVEGYDFYSVSQIGTAAGGGSRGRVFGGNVNGLPRYYLKNFNWGELGDFVTVDLSAGYQVNPIMRVNMGITNLFDTEQREFVGSPSIGRLLMVELKMEVK